MATNKVYDWMESTFDIAEKNAKREEYALFYVTDPSKPITNALIELIGERIEDLPLTYNAEEESGKDVTGNAYNDVVAYDVEMSVTPLLIKGGKKYTEHVNRLAISESTLDEVEATYLFVHKYMDDGEGGKMAYTQKGQIVMDNMASGLNGVQVNHTIKFTGPRSYGIFDDADTGKFEAVTF